MLKTTDLKTELVELQGGLHELFEDKDLLKEARKLEQKLGTIIHRAEEYTGQLELLMEFSSILNSTLDTGKVRELAMQATCKLLRCDGATLYLVDEAKKELYFEAIVGSVSKQSLKEIRLPINEDSIAGWVAFHRESQLINDVGNDFRHYKKADTKNKFQTKNMICVPLLTKGQILGVLQAINSNNQDFSPDDMRILETLAHQVAIAVENSRLYENLKSSFLETVSALASAIDAKDRYTGGHTKRVALYSELIAKYMGYTKEQLEEVRMAATLHDIGKIGVDDKVLKKEAPLDDEEWKHMKGHPEMGYRILGHIKGLKYVTDGMRYHHERPDGNGYPLGLKGEETPMIARIISVADTFDAMTSNRPYRKGLDYNVAYQEIVKYRGTQFDEKVVDAFIEAFRIERMGKKRLK